MNASLVAILLLCLALASAPGRGAVDDPPNGERIYRTACLQCHGVDGTGAPSTVLGFDLALPDFSDCAFGTAEARADWTAIITKGGPARGFSQRMPAFGDALSPHEITAVIAYLRTLCSESRAWPVGDLNFPRPLVTEKAFPENEAVLTSGSALEGDGAVLNELVFERRFGPRSQFEVVVPFGWQERTLDRATGSVTSWIGGIGDVEAGVKHVLFHDNDRRLILSAAATAILPTGSVRGNFGSGTTVFESFLAAGAALPRRGFLQLQSGVGLPVQLARAPRDAFWRGVLGITIPERQFGRAWSPMVEVLGARDLVAGAPTDWDLIPQFQVTLSARQHVRANVGVRVPVNRSGVRQTELLAYLLWDWFDGGFRQGW
ncbi:MAG TPA: cytochrome c [Gemmatimonadaceae bacterium]|nr:cytochrome c [Gemmatimonadaceae bacterium]